MALRIESRHLSDVVVIVPQVYKDQRGFFMEAYRADQFRELGLPHNFVQENHSYSKKGVLRGLHFQWDPPMGKLMRVTQGRAYLVAVDIRKRSPTLGQWTGATLSADDMTQMWAPAGFARGFCVLSDFAEIQYLCTGVYNSAGEAGIRWNDPELGIRWPTTTPILSGKDTNAPSLREWLATPHSNNFIA